MRCQESKLLDINKDFSARGFLLWAIIKRFDSDVSKGHWQSCWIVENGNS
jgi:hypothetical protein